MFFCQGTIYLPISECISVAQVRVQFTQECVFGAWQKETSVKFLLKCGTDSQRYANIHTLLYKHLFLCRWVALQLFDQLLATGM